MASPYLATISLIRATPRSTAPIIARRSPKFWRGVRTLASSSFQTSSTSSPRFLIFTGGTRRPSWKISVASPQKAPGTMPPISAMWPMQTARPRSSPSLKNGLKKVCSGQCSPPR